MTDLEQLVRDTLANRAQTVNSGPPWQPETVSSLRRPRVWVAPLIAAAVIVAVAATVVGIRQAGQGNHAAHKSASPSPAPTTPSPLATQPPATTTCSAALPAAWRTAIENGATTAGAPSAFPLAVTAQGRLLVSRDFGTSRDVALVNLDGTPRTIYEVPSPDEYQVLSGVVEGDWAMIAVSHLPRNANGVLPRVVRILLVNLRTGERRVIFDQVAQDIVAGVNFVDGATLFGGRVYYDMRPRFTKPNGIVRAYDISARTDRVIASGPINFEVGPKLTARGVSWSTDTAAIAVPRSVPAQVQRAATSKRALASLTSDGTTYAWTAARRELLYWAPGMATPKPFDLGLPHSVVPSLVAVAGPIVLYGGSGKYVHALDTRTGATTSLQTVQPFALAANGVVVAFRFTGGFKESPTAAVRIDAAHLPELHC